MKMAIITLLHVFASTVLAAANASQKPNILFMLVDDLGHNDMEWNDEFGQITSPKINALRQSGITLDNYYVYRFCSPTRSTFTSGRYPWHIGQQTNMNLNPTPGIACGINLNYTFLPKLLKTQGYNTWALGKWHLGFHRKEYTPTYRGFDHYLGYYSGAEEHFTHEKAGIGHSFYDLANNSGTEVNACLGPVGNASNIYSSYVYANETLRLLDQHNPDTDGPIYVYQAWNNVHAPNEAPDSYLDMHSNIKDKGRRGLAGMVSALDDAFAAIVAKLKEKNMWDNTLVIFSTDNGGNLGGSGINYPLRGGKYTFWEGGVRGLGFVSGGLVPANLHNTTWSGVMHAADWYTTIAALAGADPSETGTLPPDGVDVSKELLSGNQTSPRTEVVLQILSNSSGNDFEPAPSWYCQDPPEGSDAKERCRAAVHHEAVTAQLDASSVSVRNRHTGEVVALSVGVLRQGKWKLAWGYPGWKPQPKWDGWIQPPDKEMEMEMEMEMEDTNTNTNGTCDFPVNRSGDVQCKGLDKQEKITTAKDCADTCCNTKGCTVWQFEDDCFLGLDGKDHPCVSPSTTKKHNWVGFAKTPAGKPCLHKPCLFDVVSDPTEHHDVADDNPQVVAAMQARILELLKGEVTLGASKLCPETTGTKSDPLQVAKAEATGFWEPYLTTPIPPH